jgi:putative holliday junction resolvase
MVDSNKAETSHYLGIDYGKAKIGLAIADSETKIAFAYGTIDNNQELFARLLDIMKKENINQVIIGIPLYVNRKEIEYDGEIFGRKLKDKTEAKIEYQDEMFSTKIAHDNLIAKGAKKIKRLDDQEAARIILQNWMDKNFFRA